jgi:type I restriction enzyme, S subunit
VTDGLTERDRQGILTVLEGFPKIRRAVLFGSRAIGTFRGASDLDLAIEGDNLKLTDLVAVRSCIGRLELPFEADIVIRSKITNPDVEAHIRRYGRVFYERKTTSSNLSQWPEMTLSQVIDVKHGFAFPGENIRDEPPGDVLLTPGNFAIGGGFKGEKFKYFDGDVPEEYVLSEGDLLVTMTDLSKQADTLGYPAFVPKPNGPRFLHNQRLGKVVIKPDAELDTRFLFYLLRTAEYRHEVLASATGTTVKHTSPGRILAHKAKIPLPNEQRAIASVLGALDDKIELNRRMNEKLEALAQTLFKSWFVDATATALPKGWREVPLPEAIEVNPSRSLRKGEVAPYLDMANMPTRSARALEIIDREFGSGMRFKNGDTLVARITPCLENGKTCFVDFLNAGQIAWGSTEYIVLQPKPPLPPEFAYFLARTDEFRAFMISNMTGTTGRQRVPADCLNNFSIAVPPAELAAKFGEFARSVFAQMKAHDEESRTLAALRDALLPKLLSGELRVPAAAKLVDATA